MTLLILAAGMGSRYGGLKQIDPIGPSGEFIIDYSIYDAIKAGFDKIVFVIKKENYNDFKETVGARVEPFIKVEYAFQDINNIPEGFSVPEGRVKPWGTSHAVLSAKQYLTENFAVINSDDFYGRDTFMKLAEHLKNADSKGGVSHSCMIGYILKNTLTDKGTVSRGVCRVDDDNMLTEIVETTAIAPNGDMAKYIIDDKEYDLDYNTIVSMNCWGFTPDVLSHIEKDFLNFLGGISDNPMKKECYLPMSVGQMMKDGVCDVKVYSTNAKWYGVTYSADRDEVVGGIRSLVDNGEYPIQLWK